MDADRPIARPEDDRLGFAPVAKQLARSIMDQSAEDGLVFGIEGKWGSGKSSLINLTIAALRRQGHSSPEVIAFSPWLVGDRDELLRSLFHELADAAVKIDPIESALSAEDADETWWQWIRRRLVPDQHWKLRQKERLRRQIGGKLRTFGSLAGTFGKFARAAGTLGVPAANQIAEAFEHGSAAAHSFLLGGSVSDMKADLVAALKQLSRRIVVFVDDLDRLEPREASEMLRLIRAVADFPNVIYVLSYDPQVVAQTLQIAVQVDDGAAFLEKIVQVSFRVPRPEAFDLRRWFQDELYTLFPNELTAADASQLPVTQRLAEVIDMQGGKYLEVPRDVVKVLNGLRLHAIPVRDRIDIPDMVWLQLVKVGNPAFYEWIEEYLTEVAAVASGARITEEAARAAARRLSTVLADEEVDFDHAAISLADILPGLNGNLSFGTDREDRRVFNRLGDQIINRFVASKRLGSPQHYRYYYAFSEPAGALRDDQAQAFIAASERSSGDAIREFAELASQPRPQGGTMAEVLIDRLVALADGIPEAAIPGIFASLAENMDSVALASRGGDFGEHRAWLPAMRAVSVLLQRLSGEARASSLRLLFENGRALGWLTSIFRNETFSHGLYGDRAEPEDRWLLTAAEFDYVLATMLQRFRSTPALDLMRVPNLMSLLYGWQQASGTNEARQWVETQTRTDEGLLEFLSRARGWAINDAIGLYFPLKQRDLENFLDFDDARRRLQSISTSASALQGQRELASELLVAIEQGLSR